MPDTLLCVRVDRRVALARWFALSCAAAPRSALVCMGRVRARRAPRHRVTAPATAFSDTCPHISKRAQGCSPGLAGCNRARPSPLIPVARRGAGARSQGVSGCVAHCRRSWWCCRLAGRGARDCRFPRPVRVRATGRSSGTASAIARSRAETINPRPARSSAPERRDTRAPSEPSRALENATVIVALTARPAVAASRPALAASAAVVVTRPRTPRPSGEAARGRRSRPAWARGLGFRISAEWSRQRHEQEISARAGNTRTDSMDRGPAASAAPRWTVVRALGRESRCPMRHNRIRGAGHASLARARVVVGHCADSLPAGAGAARPPRHGDSTCPIKTLPRDASPRPHASAAAGSRPARRPSERVWFVRARRGSRLSGKRNVLAFPQAPDLITTHARQEGGRGG